MTKITQLQESLKDAHKQIAALQQTQAAAQTDNWLTQTDTINGVNVLIIKVGTADLKILRDYATLMRDKIPSPSAILLAADDSGKACFVAAVNGADIQANAWMQATASVAAAKGGGKPAYAQAGGGECAQIDAALAAARAFVQS